MIQLKLNSRSLKLTNIVDAEYTQLKNNPSHLNNIIKQGSLSFNTNSPYLFLFHRFDNNVFLGRHISKYSNKSVQLCYKLPINKSIRQSKNLFNIAIANFFFKKTI